MISRAFSPSPTPRSIAAAGQIGRLRSAIHPLLVASYMLHAVAAAAALVVGFAPVPLGSSRVRCRSSIEGIHMMPHGKVYETPVVHAECLLLPKEPFPGTPPLPMVGEVMLQEVRHG